MDVENKNDDSQLTPENGAGLPTDENAGIPELPTAVAGQESVVPSARYLPRAGTSFLVFIAFIFTQVFFAVVLAISAVIYAVATGVDLQDKESLQPVIFQFMIYGTLPLFMISGLPVLLLTRWLAADAISDGSAVGVGWRKSSLSSVIGGLLLGVFLAFSCLVLYSTVFKRITPGDDGMVSQFANAGNLALLMFAVLALCLAPLIEEFLFRGVMMAGFTRSFGLPTAVFLCSFLFVLVHVPELIKYWPGTIGIGGLALITAWLRLQSKSLFPAMACHFGYNGLLVFLMLASPLLIEWYAKGVMQQLDANKNGSLEQAEWSKNESIENSYDSDGDGKLTLEELTKGFSG